MVTSLPHANRDMKISADRVNKIILYKTIMSKYRILTHFENEQEQEQEEEPGLTAMKSAFIDLQPLL